MKKRRQRNNNGVIREFPSHTYNLTYRFCCWLDCCCLLSLYIPLLSPATACSPLKSSLRNIYFPLLVTSTVFFSFFTFSSRSSMPYLHLLLIPHVNPFLRSEEWGGILLILFFGNNPRECC